MTTEGDHQSFYIALYNALTDCNQIGALLAHPEFRKRGRQFCYGIAGADDSEDLFQEACSRVWEDVVTLNPNNIRNEDEFFSWFYKLARNVYISDMREMADINNCTAKARRWPEAAADVSLEEMDEFLEHVDVCPYHTAILRADEEKLQAVIRQARGLDSHGRILQGTELQAAIADHKRRLKNWNEAALRKEMPFSQISLYNGGKEIASCGKFFDLTKHESLNELDPQAGLQIRGIGSSDADEDVLLGFYALAGVRHRDEEQFLQLENGYTVGLRIKKLSDRNYEVHFRCFETKEIEAEQASADDDMNTSAGTMDNGASVIGLPLSRPSSSAPPLANYVPPGANGWLPFPIGGQAVALCALVILVIFMVSATMITNNFRHLEDVTKQEEKSEPFGLEYCFNLPPPSQERYDDANLEGLNDTPRPAFSPTPHTFVQPAKRRSARMVRSGQKFSGKDLAQYRNLILAQRVMSADGRIETYNKRAAAFLAYLNLIGVNSQEMEGYREITRILQEIRQPQESSAPVTAGNSPRLVAATASSEDVKVEYDWRLRSSADTTQATGNQILHTGKDKMLERALFSKMRTQSLPVYFVAKTDTTPVTFEIRWSAFRPVKPGEESAKVEVQAEIFNSDGIYMHKYSSGLVGGDNLANAYKAAVSKVFSSTLHEIINPSEVYQRALANWPDEGFDGSDYSTQGRAGFTAYQMKILNAISNTDIAPRKYGDGNEAQPEASDLGRSASQRVGANCEETAGQ